MLVAAQRLQWKEVRFLTKKRQVFSCGLLTIFFVEQYPKCKFHQISYHIPLLVSKRAVKRHQVKRILINHLETAFLSLDFWGKYYKCFVTLNKSNLTKLIDLLDRKDDVLLKGYLEHENYQAFTSFMSFLWKNQQNQKMLKKK